MITSVNVAMASARAAFDAAIAAAAPEKIMAKALENLATPPTRIVAVGKAAGPMAQACRDAGLTAQGLLVTHDPSVQVDGFTGVVAGHPVPDAASVAAAQAIKAMAEGLTADDHLLMLLSGGGSALMSLPAEGLTLDAKMQINDALLASGLDIHQMNAVRRLFSGIKGGRLAQAAFPATTTQWVLSDVPASGDDAVDLAAIASGPMAADPVAIEHALALVNQTGLAAVEGVRAHLAAMTTADHPRRPGDSCFDRVATTILASNVLCRRAAARALGQAATTLPELTGDAGVMAQALAHQAIDHGPGLVGVAGGETVITLPPALDPSAKGGRSQHLALCFALAMDDARRQGQKVPCWAILAAGTDGRDGPTDAAGALLHHDMPLDPAAMRKALQRYDSWGLLNAVGGLIRIPPTGTNLADLVILLTW